MVDPQRLICQSAAVGEGSGLRFEIQRNSVSLSAFVVRHRGSCRAYVNECPHARTELDWEPGEFFDSSGLYLICATHGAMFEPATGRCVAGPCRGQKLRAVEVVERGGEILLNQV